MREGPFKFDAIETFLSSWLAQLAEIRTGDEYAAILSELESPPDSGFAEHLPLLNEHLKLASSACSNFSQVLQEKARLPSLIHEANVTILNKLSEIRAVVGLSRSGFHDIRFSATPDFVAVKQGQTAAIEVTRLGRSLGRRSDVWDYQAGAADLESLEEVGYRIGLMSSGGRVEDALSEAIYREIEDKYRQVRKDRADLRIIWISLGRDYLKCGRYELEGMGSFKRMPRTAANTVTSAVLAHRAAGTCQLLTNVVLCPGRNLQDMLIDVRND